MLKQVQHDEYHGNIEKGGVKFRWQKSQARRIQCHEVAPMGKYSFFLFFLLLVPKGLLLKSPITPPTKKTPCNSVFSVPLWLLYSLSQRYSLNNTSYKKPPCKLCVYFSVYSVVNVFLYSLVKNYALIALST